MDLSAVFAHLKRTTRVTPRLAKLWEITQMRHTFTSAFTHGLLKFPLKTYAYNMFNLMLKSKTKNEIKSQSR